jgi:SpoVK/Ycf46/Vps4 family AAA+-type ATPase
MTASNNTAFPFTTNPFADASSVAKIVINEPATVQSKAPVTAITTTSVFDLNFELKPPTAFDDYIGNRGIVNDMVNNLITFHNSRVMAKMKLSTGSSVILHGPGGTGKTLFAKKSFEAAQQISAQYGEYGLKFKWYQFKCSEIVSKYRGEAILNINAKFDEIYAYFAENPLNKAIILFDEFDSLARSVQGSSENDEAKNLLNELKILLADDRLQSNAILIACTNKYEDLDEAVVRDGRFNTKVFIDYTKPLEDIKKLINFFLNLKEVGEEITDDFVDNLSKVFFASGITTPAMIKTLVERAVLNSTNEMVLKHPMFNFQIFDDHLVSSKLSKSLIIRYFDEKHLYSSMTATVQDLYQRVDDQERVALMKAIIGTIAPLDDNRNTKGHPEYEDPLLAICRVKPGNLNPEDPNLTCEEIRAELFYFRERLDQVAKDNANIQRLKSLADKLTELETPAIPAASTEVVEGEIVETLAIEQEKSNDSLALAIVKYSYPEDN